MGKIIVNYQLSIERAGKAPEMEVSQKTCHFVFACIRVELESGVDEN